MGAASPTWIGCCTMVVRPGLDWNTGGGSSMRSRSCWRCPSDRSGATASMSTVTFSNTSGYKSPSPHRSSTGASSLASSSTVFGHNARQTPLDYDWAECHFFLSQGSLAEITNQRFSLKYQTFRQLAAAFISSSS